MKLSRIMLSLALAWLVGLGAAAPLAAQTDSQGGPQVTVVSVDNSNFPTLTLKLNVVDATGQPVRGLTPGAISVKEDQDDAEVVSVKDIEDTQQGLAVVLVIDVSGSMAGEPIAAARAAAAAFINSLSPNDQVAILTFDRKVTPLLGFGAKKEDALYIIQNLSQTPGGATALYDAAKQGVLTAVTSSLPRRMVILLSDGKEYPGTSLSAREEAYKEATAKGVTLYTLGLGAQIDEAYLRQLAGLTGGVYLSAPSPAELTAKWQEIATFMRQLVEVQVKSHKSGAGRRHDLTVSVKIGNQTVEAKNYFFSKAVAPQVTVVGLPQTAIEAETPLTARVEAAASILRVTFNVDGKLLAEDASAPWEANLDPLKLAPGAHRLEIVATDADGLTGSTTADFQVAALAPKIELTLTEGQLVEQPLSLMPAITAQGEIKEVKVTIDGGQAETVAQPPYRFELDPTKLPGGVHKLAVTVTDSNGQTASKEVGFSTPKTASAPAAPIPGAASGGEGFSPMLIGVIILAIIVLAGIVGYVLVRRAPARAAQARGPQLRVSSGLEKGQTFPITPTPQIIGRLSSAPIHLSDPTGALRISREHARVWLEEGVAWIEDAGSRHGTYVDGNRLAARFRLISGARIKLGEVELVAEGIARAVEDLRATTFSPLDKTRAAAAAQASARETQASSEAENRATKVKPPAEADETGMEAGRVTRTQTEDQADAEDRQTRLKPAEATPAPQADAEADWEAGRVTKMRVEASTDTEDTEDRQTRLKPAEAIPAPQADAETGLTTQTRLKPADAQLLEEEESPTNVESD